MNFMQLSYFVGKRKKNYSAINSNLILDWQNELISSLIDITFHLRDEKESSNPQIVVLKKV